MKPSGRLPACSFEPQQWAYKGRSQEQQHHSWPTSPLPCHGDLQMDQQRKPPNPKMHQTVACGQRLYMVFVQFACCSWVKDFLKCQAASCSKRNTLVCLSHSFVQHTLPGVWSNQMSIPFHLSSSKFHIQSPLKKTKTYWYLLSDMGYDVSFNTLLFFGGIRSTWDSIEKCVSVSLISAISQNTQPVETSSPRFAQVPTHRKPPSWSQISSKIWRSTQLVPWRCSPYRNDWCICLFGERHVGKVEAVRDGKLQNMWWKKTTIDIYIYIHMSMYINMYIHTYNT